MSKYRVLKTNTPNTPWGGTKSVNNVRSYPKVGKKK